MSQDHIEAEGEMMPRAPRRLTVAEFELLLDQSEAHREFGGLGILDLTVALQVAATKTQTALVRSTFTGKGTEAMDPRVRAHLATTLSIFGLLVKKVGVDLEHLAEVALHAHDLNPPGFPESCPGPRQSVEVLR